MMIVRNNLLRTRPALLITYPWARVLLRMMKTGVSFKEERESLVEKVQIMGRLSRAHHMPYRSLLFSLGKIVNHARTTLRSFLSNSHVHFTHKCHFRCWITPRSSSSTIPKGSPAWQAGSVKLVIWAWIILIKKSRLVYCIQYTCLRPRTRISYVWPDLNPYCGVLRLGSLRLERTFVPNETKASSTFPKDERTMTHWGFEIVRIDSVLVKVERGYVTVYKLFHWIPSRGPQSTGSSLIQMQKVASGHKWQPLVGGDIVLELEGKPVTQILDFMDMFTRETLAMKVVRKRVELNVVVPTVTISNWQCNTMVPQFESLYFPTPLLTGEMYS